MPGHRQLTTFVGVCLVVAGTGLAAQSPGGAGDRAEPPRIQLEEFRPLQATGAALIIDVRDQATFRLGHIPGAISVPVDQIEARAADIEARAKSRPIVTYCSCPNDHASVSAAALLAARGVCNVRALAGGLPAWVAAGGSLLRGGLVGEKLPKRLF
ncbi:MAG: rhodanese-like domain-containing protein [Vicinamibacterales bacterium]